MNESSLPQLAVLLLGSNMGDRMEFLKMAFHFLTTEIGQLDRISSVYESSPWGLTAQPAFLNQVVGVHTYHDPRSVLQRCLAFEKSAGRTRELHWGPRTIDIDLLYYAERILDEEGLRIPHPGISYRKFTLLPLCESYPTLRHPESGLTQCELMQQCNDPGEVNLASVNA